MANALARLRANPPTSLGGRAVVRMDDLAQGADGLCRHGAAFSLRDFAGGLNSSAKAERVLVDDPALRLARLALLLATRQVLRNGLALIGVSAPERM